MEHPKSNRRACRRHHRERLKARRARYHGNVLALVAPAARPKCLGRILATPKSCSCVMCGNPRARLHERTRQEDEADRVLHEALGFWWSDQG